MKKKQNKEGQTPAESLAVQGIRWGLYLALGLIVLVGLVIFPIAKSHSILGGNEVNLAGPFFFFIVIQIFFLTLSVFFYLFSFLYSIVKRIFHFESAGDTIGFDRQLVSWFGSFLLVAVCKADEWRLRFLHKIGHVQKDQSELSENFSSVCAYLLKKRRSFFNLSICFSHLFWLGVSVLLLLCLLLNMQKTIYCYRWESSITSVQEVRVFLEKTSFLYPSSLHPSERDILSLFESGETTGKSVLRHGSEMSEIRKSWSLFVLWSVLISCVFPRAILAVIFFYRFKRMSRQFELSDIKSQTKQSSPEVYAPELDQNGTLPLPLKIDMEAKDTDLSLENSSISVAEPEIPRDKTIVFGFDTSMPETDWRKIIEIQDLVCYDDIAVDRQRRKDFRERMAGESEQLDRLIVLLDSSISPARQAILYFGELVKQLSKTRFYFILSCGGRLSFLFDRNAEKIGQRLNDWRSALMELGKELDAELTIVDFFDHENATPESYDKIRAFFSGCEYSPSVNNDKMERSFALIEAECFDVFQENAQLPSSETNEVSNTSEINDPILRQEEEETRNLERLTKLYRNIEGIYKEESTVFLEKCTQTIQTGRTITTEVASGVCKILPGLTDSDLIASKLLPAAELMDRVKRICSGLSPRCALVAGALGAILPLSAVVAPLAAGGLTLGTLAAAAGSLGTFLPASFISGGAGAALGAFIPQSFTLLRRKITSGTSNVLLGEGRDSASLMNEGPGIESVLQTIETLVGTGALWTIVFELQGETEEEIALALPKILNPIENSDLNTQEEVKRVLHAIFELRTRRR